MGINGITCIYFWANPRGVWSSKIVQEPIYQAMSCYLPGTQTWVSNDFTKDID